MSEKTKIAWCDSTVNFWEGCTKVSAGCANCYAEARDRRFTGGKLWGVGAPRRKSKSAVKDAMRYNKLPWICDQTGECFSDGGRMDSLADQGFTFHRRRIFSLSLGDIWDNEVPIEWLAEALNTIRKCDQVTWILCSKRWENWFSRCVLAAKWSREYASPNLMLEDWIEGKRIVPSNIIGLCSVENQEAADKRIPQFLTVPLACRGLSMEPLLGAVDLSGKASWRNPHNSNTILRPIMFDIDWLIIGGESGTNARPCNVDWIRSIVQQGKAAGVATFVKQMGSYPTATNEDEKFPVGFFADKKGGDPSEWPLDLRVQEWPKGF